MLKDHQVAWQRRSRAAHAARTAVARAARGDKCEDCMSPDNLEWDHIDPATKVMAISRMNTATDEIFWAEVAKCRLLCRTCHIKKTSKNGEWNNQHGVPTPEHGLSAYKRHGCRCDVCRAAKSAENASRDRRRKHV